MNILYRRVSVSLSIVLKRNFNDIISVSKGSILQFPYAMPSSPSQEEIGSPKRALSLNEENCLLGSRDTPPTADELSSALDAWKRVGRPVKKEFKSPVLVF